MSSTRTQEKGPFYEIDVLRKKLGELGAEEMIVASDSLPKVNFGNSDEGIQITFEKSALRVFLKRNNKHIRFRRKIASRLLYMLSKKQYVVINDMIVLVDKRSRVTIGSNRISIMASKPGQKQTVMCMRRASILSLFA